MLDCVDGHGKSDLTTVSKRRKSGDNIHVRVSQRSDFGKQLKSNAISLQKKLIAGNNLDAVMKYMVSKHVFTIQEVRKIEEREINYDQYHDIINLLKSKGNDAFNVFIDALDDSNIDHNLQRTFVDSRTTKKM